MGTRTENRAVMSAAVPDPIEDEVADAVAIDPPADGPGAWQVHSPMPYLDEEIRFRDSQAWEALFTTYNADLGFFERVVLGTTQATGARVTLVADAHVWSPDPRAGRNAGTRYVPGLAATSGRAAFHPKVTVLVGPARLLVVVGSGNLSLGGWHLNAETWTIARGDLTGCPELVWQVADWLRTLQAVVSISPSAGKGIDRTVLALDRFTAEVPVVSTPHRLVHTSANRILDQLPDPNRSDGPSEPVAVHTLRLHAPFHDPKGQALGELVRRYAPARVLLAVQPSRTVLDPAAINAVMKGLRGEGFGTNLQVVAEPGSSRYRHGKLVEAVSADGAVQWSLTGSANLSWAAMLSTVGAGGNVEVGVVTKHSWSLFPPGDPIDLTDVPRVVIASGADQDDTGRAAGPVLLEALRTPDGLRLLLARPLAVDTAVEISEGTAYDEWRKVADLTWSEEGVPPEARTREHVLAGVEPHGASRVRLTWAVPADTATSGGREPAQLIMHGEPQFVVDPDRVLATARDMTSGANRAGNSNTIDLLGDAALLERWLARIAQAQTSAALPSASGVGAPRAEDHDEESISIHGRHLDDGQAWLTQQDAAKARLGPRMFQFAIGGMPAARALDSTNAMLNIDTSSDAIVDERTAGLDEDDSEVINDETDPTDASRLIDDDHLEAARRADEAERTRIAALTVRERRRIQRLLGHYVRQDAQRFPAIDRLAIVGVLLFATQRDVWTDSQGGGGWIPLLADALCTLDRLDASGATDIPESLFESFGSLAAVGAFLLSEQTLRRTHTDSVSHWNRAVAGVSHLLSAATWQQVSIYAAEMRGPNRPPIDPDDVLRVAELIVQNDPILDAVELIEALHPAWRIHRHASRVLHVEAEGSRNPGMIAAEVMDGLSVSADPVVVRATGSQGIWAVLVRDAEMLTAITVSRSGRPWWQPYRLTDRMSAKLLVSGGEGTERSRVRNIPLTAPYPPAVAALRAAGADEDEAHSHGACPGFEYG